MCSSVEQVSIKSDKQVANGIRVIHTTSKIIKDIMYVIVPSVEYRRNVEVMGVSISLS